ncbi:MAG: hypothetical protein JWO45_7 [Spartobacteria bacterium]|jgi:uncharacterized membrane protein YqjE|nr:hypothetical protein [Spartobacteria bacterium]
MAFPTVRSRNPAGQRGLITTLLAFCTDLAGLVESRLALFFTESKATLVQLLVLAGCVFAAILFFILGYFFLIAAGIVGLARLLEVSWVWIALIAASAHFLLALVALLIARTRMIKSPFPELSAELKKDREWLKNLDGTSRPTN